MFGLRSQTSEFQLQFCCSFLSQYSWLTFMDLFTCWFNCRLEMRPSNERTHMELYPGYHSASFVSFQWFHALYQSQDVCYHRAAISTLYSKRSQLRLLLPYFTLKRGPKHKDLVIRKRVNSVGTMFLRQRKQAPIKWVWHTVRTLCSLVSHICKIPCVSRKFCGLPTVDIYKRSLLPSPRCTQTHTLRTE